MSLSLVVITLATLLMILLMNKNIEILRDISQCENGDKPFSLSRTQLAFWLYVLLCSFVYLLDNQERDLNAESIIDGSFFWLIGISAATAIIGLFIDHTEARSSRKDFRHQDSRSGGFWKDLLFVQKRLNFFRLQFVIATISMLAFFFISALQNTMVTPPPTMLISFYAISAIAYLASKKFENRRNPHEKH